MMAMPSSKNEQ
jgi:hypothetical protein